jgi:hypothetical protein
MGAMASRAMMADAVVVIPEIFHFLRGRRCKMKTARRPTRRKARIRLTEGERSQRCIFWSFETGPLHVRRAVRQRQPGRPGPVCMSA